MKSLRQPGYRSADKHLRPYGFASLSFDRFALSTDYSIVIYINTTIICVDETTKESFIID